MLVHWKVDSRMAGLRMSRARDTQVDLPLQMEFADHRVVLANDPTRLRRTRKAHRNKDNAEAHVRISKEVARKLRLPTTGSLHAVTDGDKWILGPCLGVYVTRESSGQRLFGEQTVLLRDLSQIGHQCGIDIVVLTPGFREHGQGWRFDEGHNQWLRMPIPLPHLVLRRSGRFRESGKLVQQDLIYLEQLGILHTLPRQISNKWTFYRIACRRKEVCRYLPLTRRVTSGRDLKIAIGELGDVYLKPVGGAQGAAIHRMIRSRNGVKVIRERRLVNRETDRQSSDFRPGTTIEQQTLSTERDVQRFWDSLQSSFKRWVVQKSVPLTKFPDGRPVDFRWLVQWTDQPVVVGRVARIGSKGAVTTNLHTGGTAMDAEVALDRLEVKDPERILERMDEMSIQVMQALRDAYGSFAEVGIDLGLDTNGRIYVFEVNPTPGRRMLRSVSDSVRELSLRNLAEYAIKATDFAKVAVNRG